MPKWCRRRCPSRRALEQQLAWQIIANLRGSSDLAKPLAGLVVPLIGGLYWPKATRQGALACIVAGSLTRLAFFIFMPTMFGVDNTLLYVPNGLFTIDFDGFPTMISPIVGLVAFVVVSNLTHRPQSPEAQKADLLEKTHAL